MHVAQRYSMGGEHDSIRNGQPNETIMSRNPVTISADTNAYTAKSSIVGKSYIFTASKSTRKPGEPSLIHGFVKEFSTLNERNIILTVHFSTIRRRNVIHYSRCPIRVSLESRNTVSVNVCRSIAQETNEFLLVKVTAS